MIEKQFYIDEYNCPVFSTNEEYYMLWELGSCEKSYIDIIVLELERVKKGELDAYYFGYERYGVDCDNQSCALIDTFKNVDLKIVPLEEIYTLMKSWKEYYESWERENPDKA